MTPTQNFGDLLARLGVLLEEMAVQCHDIEDMAILWSPSDRPAHSDRTESLIAFQKLDRIAQSLHDLSSLAHAIRATPLADFRVDPTTLRSSLRLHSIADRLLTDTPTEHDHDEFLL